jgi:hypothetical protein
MGGFVSLSGFVEVRRPAVDAFVAVDVVER